MHSSYLVPFMAILAGVSASVRTVAEPVIKVKNGSYVGVHSSIYNQDFFLGIPYARPPVGDLRFRIPQSLNTSWTGIRSAKEYPAEVRA